MRVALLGDIGMSEDDTRAALQRAAEAAGTAVPETVRYTNAIDLIDDIADATSGRACSVAVFAQDAPGMSGIQIASELRDVSAAVRIVLVADDAARAFEASQLDVNGYLVRPVSESAFARTLTAQLREAEFLHRDSVALRFRDHPRIVRLSDILYSETSNHDQIVHLRDRSSESMRISSQALFDQLSHDGRFFKIGSSYIVNLDEVAELRNGNATLVFTSGTSVPVPVRMRKPLENALLSDACNRTERKD